MNEHPRIRRENGRTYYLDTLIPRGPWDSEPDHVDFEHVGFPCILHRNGLGAWCGYVAVPPGHPWHGVAYADVRTADADDTWPDVHGGLTYSGKCHGDVCHVAKPGEPDDVWWLGFDCIHSGDVSLSDHKYGHVYGHYRAEWYARRETERLAEQAKAVHP